MLGGFGSASWRDPGERDHLCLASLSVQYPGARHAAEPTRALRLPHVYAGVHLAGTVLDPDFLAFRKSPDGVAHPRNSLTTRVSAYRLTAV